MSQRKKSVQPWVALNKETTAKSSGEFNVRACEKYKSFLKSFRGWKLGQASTSLPYLTLNLAGYLFKRWRFAFNTLLCVKNLRIS